MRDEMLLLLLFYKFIIIIIIIIIILLVYYYFFNNNYSPFFNCWFVLMCYLLTDDYWVRSIVEVPAYAEQCKFIHVWYFFYYYHYCHLKALLPENYI